MIFFKFKIADVRHSKVVFDRNSAADCPISMLFIYEHLLKYSINLQQ